jgi:hypothetical protein
MMLEGVTMSTVGKANPCTPTSLYRGALDFLKAADTLTPGETPYAFGAVAGHCLELTLKAYLLHVGVSEDDLKNSKLFGHDLTKAWNRCVAERLGIAATMPDWAKSLDAGHDSPFPFRYQPNNTGISLSPKSAIIAGLRSVMAVVQAATGVT